MRLGSKIRRLEGSGLIPAPRSGAPKAAEEALSTQRAESLSGVHSEAPQGLVARELSTPGSRPSSLSEALRAAFGSRTRRVNTEDAPAYTWGRCFESPWGLVHQHEERHATHQVHGNAPLQHARDLRPESLACLALEASLIDCDPAEFLFIDTETTGLMGGSGTLAFLVGLAWFEGDALCLQQLFLRGPEHEAALLHTLAAKIERASCLVSFNGKSYDWPLLRNRFVMQRLALPAAKPHLDLLHCARRVVAQGSCRLVELESRLLDFERQGDIEGALIPELYRAYLRERKLELLGKVFEHNRLDVLSMVALLGRLSRPLETPPQQTEAAERLRYARLCSRYGDESQALDMVRSVAVESQAQRAQALHFDALCLQAELARKGGRSKEELFYLLRALRLAPGGRCPELRLRIAKLYEHRHTDLHRALRHARAAAQAEEASRHERRIARLERRIARSTPPAPGPRFRT